MPPNLCMPMRRRAHGTILWVHGGKKGVIQTGCPLALAKKKLPQLPLKLWVGMREPSMRLLLNLQEHY